MIYNFQSRLHRKFISWKCLVITILNDQTQKLEFDVGLHLSQDAKAVNIPEGTW